MSKMFSFAVVAVLLSLAFVSSAAAGDGPPGISLGPPIAIPAKVVGVSPDEAAAAARYPGRGARRNANGRTTTVGQLVREQVGAPGRLLQSHERRRVDEGLRCFYGEAGVTSGYFPIDRTVTDHTYWCAGASSFVIRSRSTWVTTDTTLCNSNGPYNYHIIGGIGFTYLETETGGYFSCSYPPIGGWTLHDRLWERLYFDGAGAEIEYATGDA
jgi:hypothetical protein